MKDLPYHALFVGDGYARTEMQAMAAKLGLSGNSDYRMDKVTFFGSVQSRELMQTIYTAADLFLFPSIYDNAPLVVREAASLFTPSIVARGSNTAEIIQNGINGFLSDSDVTAFATDSVIFWSVQPSFPGRQREQQRPWCALGRTLL